FGPRDFAQQLADEIELRLEPLGMKVELVTRYPTGEFGLQLPADTVVSPAVSLAAGKLAGRKPPFELLPPRLTQWQQLSSRYSSGRLRMAGAAAAVLLLLCAGVFLVQQWQLMRLRSQWFGMTRKTAELEKLTDQIHQYRPWFDESLRALTI